MNSKQDTQTHSVELPVASSEVENNNQNGCTVSHSSDIHPPPLPSQKCESITRGEEVTIHVDIDTTYPNDAWQERYCYQFKKAKTVEPASLYSEGGPAENMIRFVCLSDTHSRVESGDFYTTVPDGDVLLHAGDFTMHSRISEYSNFNDFLKKLPHKIKLVIPGNHELALDPRGHGVDVSTLRKGLGLPRSTATPDDQLKEVNEAVKGLVSEARILIDEMVEICGVKVYGLPWLPVYGLFAFGHDRGVQLLRKYNRCPAGVDILLSHGPCLGFNDVTTRRKHVGCVELLNSVTKRIKPKYFVSGHIHEAHGISTDGSRTYINCAICTAGYKARQTPVIFDFPLPHPYTRKDFDLLNPHDLEVTKPWYEQSAAGSSR